MAPTSVNITAGGTGTATATITRGGGFAGNVSLSATGAPSGATVTFVPAAVAANATTSEIDISAPASVAAGTYTVVIHAAGTGVTTATANLTVVILGADAGGFSLAAAPATLTAPVGGAAQTSVITITRTAPFAGAVVFSVTGAPAGVTTSFTPPSATGASSTLSVTASATALNGTYPLVVRGTGVGVGDATTNVSVTVTGGATAGVTLALAPSSLALTAGGATGASTLTITRAGGFTGAVGVAITGMPTGMTAVPNPASIGAGATTSAITVGAASTVAAGTYNLVVTATGTGITATPITLPVTVSSASGGGSVTVAYCAEDAPIWVAAQDGSGAWTHLTPTTGSTYTFNFTSGKGGIATVDTSGVGGANTDLSVTYGSVAEFTNAAGAINFGGCGSKTLNGTVSGLLATDAAFVSMGFSTGFVLPGGTTYTLNDVSSGPQTLVARSIDGTTQATEKLVINRNVNIPQGTPIPNIDFSGGFAPATETVSVSGFGTDNTDIASIFYGNRGSAFAAIGAVSNYTTGSVPISAIPVAQLQSGETQLVEALASGTNGDRTAGVFFRTPGTVAITVGPALSAPTITKAATTPYIRPQLVLTGQTQYNRLVSASYNATSGTASMDISATAGYFGAAPATWTVTFPDLSAVAGFNNAWGIATGVSFDWDVNAQGGAIAFIDANITDGATTQSASASSTSPVTLRTQRSGTSMGLLEGRLLQAFKRSNPM